MPVKLLITNDDGIYAEGIQLLSKVLFESGRYRLKIVAQIMSAAPLDMP